MTLFAQEALQKALLDALKADTALMRQISGVFDYVPPQTPYPYITFGEIRLKDESSIAALRLEAEVNLQFYSQQPGRKEISALMQHVHAALHLVVLVCVDFTMFPCRFVNSAIRLQGDGVTYQGGMRYVVKMGTL